MNTEYTQGFWYTGSEEATQSTEVFGEDGYVIANCNNKRPEDEKIANANLIASAPELLWALELMVSAIKTEISIFGGAEQRGSRLYIAEKAIAKAKGK